MVVKVTLSMLKLIALILVTISLLVLGQPLWAAPAAPRVRVTATFKIPRSRNQTLTASASRHTMPHFW